MYYFHVLIEFELCCITVPKEKCIYFSSKIEESRPFEDKCDYLSLKSTLLRNE